MIATGTVPVLDSNDQRLLVQLIETYNAKRARNVLRSVYYDGKNALKDFGISIPPQMRNVEVVLGWIAKGVNALTDRSEFEGFVSAAGENDPLGVESIMADNDFAVEFPMATASSAIHSCAFVTVTHGDVASGEPEIMLAARAADESAAVWDRRRRRIGGFLSVVEVDSNDQQPSVMVMYTPEKVVTLRRGQGRWVIDVRTHPLGEVPVARLPFKPELKRPFGHSRISRASMYYTDAALRTVLRSEVSAEFYSAPEYWLFGADVSKFQNADKWTAVMGRIKALEHDVEDPTPQLHRFSGSTPQPHTDQLRMWATLFAGDQGLALSSLGIVQDNPSSAEAIYAAKEDLIIDTRNANRVWGQGAVKAMQLAVRLRDGLDAVPDELRTLHAQFKDPVLVSPTAAADAFSKKAAAIDGFATSEVGLEEAGLPREKIIRFQAEQRRAGSNDRLAALVEAARGVRNGDGGAGGGVSSGEPAVGAAGSA